MKLPECIYSLKSKYSLYLPNTCDYLLWLTPEKTLTNTPPSTMLLNLLKTSHGYWGHAMSLYAVEIARKQLQQSLALFTSSYSFSTFSTFAAFLIAPALSAWCFPVQSYWVGDHSSELVCLGARHQAWGDRATVATGVMVPQWFLHLDQWPSSCHPIEKERFPPKNSGCILGKTSQNAW